MMEIAGIYSNYVECRVLSKGGNGRYHAVYASLRMKVRPDRAVDKSPFTCLFDGLWRSLHQLPVDSRKHYWAAICQCPNLQILQGSRPLWILHDRIHETKEGWGTRHAECRARTRRRPMGELDGIQTPYLSNIGTNNEKWAITTGYETRSLRNWTSLYALISVWSHI